MGDPTADAHAPIWVPPVAVFCGVLCIWGSWNTIRRMCRRRRRREHLRRAKASENSSSISLSLVSGSTELRLQKADENTPLVRHVPFVKITNPSWWYKSDSCIMHSAYIDKVRVLVKVRRAAVERTPGVDIAEALVNASAEWDELKLACSVPDHQNLISPNAVCTDFLLQADVSVKPVIAIAYDFSTGGTLRRYLDQTTTIPPKKIISYGLAIAEGLLHMHKNNFIHRNLSTRNVMLLTKNKSPFLAGLGCCKGVEDYECPPFPSEDRHTVDTGWLPPETMESDIFTFESDVWQFGIVLWELVCCGQRFGRKPFAEVTFSEARLLKTLKMIMEDVDGEVPLKFPGSAPSNITHMIEHCCSFRPADRPSLVHIVGQLRSMRVNLEKSYTFCNDKSPNIEFVRVDISERKSPVAY
eukprot:94011_1